MLRFFQKLCSPVTGGQAPGFVVLILLAGFVLPGLELTHASRGYALDSYEQFQKSNQAPPPFTLTAVSDRDRVRRGETFWLALLIKLQKGWHVYSLETGNAGEQVATEIELEATGFLPRGKWQETPPRLERDEVLEKIVKIHSGQVEFSRLIQVPDNLQFGTYPLSGTLRFRSCDNRICTLPQTIRFETRVIVEAGAAGP